MAKNRTPSKHSRAARRATSPGIDTDRSLKEVSLPQSTTTSSPSTKPRPSVLSAQHSAGIQKKKSKSSRPMSAKARRRHQKGLEMAEAVVERTSAKVRRSVGRGRNVQHRAKTWDEINRDADGGLVEGQEEEDEDEEKREGVAAGKDGESGWEDVDEDGDADVDGADAGKVQQPTADVVQGDEDGDIIL